jgi:predicted DNA-binding transcriptional regulator YafY
MLVSYAQAIMGTNLGSIAENLRQVRHRIDRACTECNRSPQHVTLLAVSKTCPAEAVRAAVERAWFEQQPLRITYRDSNGIETTVPTCNCGFGTINIPSNEKAG